MPRRLANWIDSFVEYAQVYNTPERYRKWTALWTLSTACKRSVAMLSRGTLLSPNLYLILVGGPSTGKSQAVKASEAILLPATKFRLIPPSITRAGMEDYMMANLQKRKAPDGRDILSNECIGLCDEMQGILPDQDLGHLTLYNRLYDYHKRHVAQTRSHGEVKLEFPYCALLTGAQPAFLATTLPENAWGMGFMSRAILIWGVPPPRRSMFVDGEVNHKLQADLIADLQDAFTAYGWMKWDRAAEALYDEWWVAKGGLPVPKHKRLAMGYNGRRELHMAKLAMIYSLAETSSLIVEERHVAQAIGTLLEAESQMHNIFNDMANAGSMMAIEDIIEVVRNNTAKDIDTTEADLTEMLMQRFPSTQVHSLINNLQNSGVIQLAGGIDRQGFRTFKLGKKLSLT